MMRVKTPRIAIARGARRLWPVAALAVAWTALPATAGVASAGVHDSTYRQVNLISDIPGLALTDADLVNSWGVSASPGTDQAPGGALWVSDNGKDKTTLYTSGTGTTLNKVGLVVTITSGAPTGQVSNATRTRTTSWCVTRPATRGRRPSFSSRKTAESTPGTPKSAWPRALARRPR